MNYSTSCRKLFRNSGISIVTYALGFGLVVCSHAQSNKAAANLNEINMAQTTASQKRSDASMDSDAIRPFRVKIPDEVLIDLRRRIAATRWPTKEDGDASLRMGSVTKYSKEDHQA